MIPEYLLIAILVGAACLPLWAVWRHRSDTPTMSACGVVGIWVVFPLATIVAILWHRPPPNLEPLVKSRPIQIQSDGYVGSAACRSCHPHEHATWTDSYHRTMTQIAEPKTVLAQFDYAEFQAQGLTFRLRWQGDEPWAAMEMPAAKDSAEETVVLYRPIVMTTGSHHMQILWFPLQQDSRLLAMFPFVYLAEHERWIPRAAFLQPHFSLSDEIGRWNQTCIACHSTFGRPRPAKRVDPTTGQQTWDSSMPDTKVAEFGISCEACHGPGESHVTANRDPWSRYRKHWSPSGDPTIVNPASLPHDRQSQVCGQCHSVFVLESLQDWWEDGFVYRPGSDLHASPDRLVVRAGQQQDAASRLVLEEDPVFRDDHFWSDGMVRISGREYNGLIDSPCFQRGEMSCLSCHQLHQDADDERPAQDWANDQLRVDRQDNQACLQCHEEFAGDAQLIRHTHHNSDSTGSSCYNCHMSYTTYGLLKAIRSHQIDSPSVTTSQRTGRPNACNQCHLDQTLGWTSEHLANWYGTESPSLSADEQTTAASVLWLLQGDAGQRALMAWSYGWPAAQQASGTEWMVPYLSQLLEDPYAAVRLMAERSLRSLLGQDRLVYDFLGFPSEQVAAHRRVIESWTRTGRQPNRALLIDSQGQLMQADFQRLLDQRNDRPITLVE